MTQEYEGERKAGYEELGYGTAHAKRMALISSAEAAVQQENDSITEEQTMNALPAMKNQATRIARKLGLPKGKITGRLQALRAASMAVDRRREEGERKKAE